MTNMKKVFTRGCLDLQFHQKLLEAPPNKKKFYPRCLQKIANCKLRIAANSKKFELSLASFDMVHSLNMASGKK